MANDWQPAARLLVVRLVEGADPSYWIGTGNEEEIRADHDAIVAKCARYNAILADGPPVNDEQWEVRQERLSEVETTHTRTVGPVETADVRSVAVYVLGRGD